MRGAIKEFLEKSLRDITGWDDIKPIDDSTDLKQIGLDSLDKVQLIMEVEREYALNIPDAIIDSIQTVGNLIDYIEKNVKDGDATREKTIA